MKTLRDKQISKLLPKQTLHWLLFLGILAIYTLLIVPTLNHMGIGWDEDVDHKIAQGYLTPRGLLFGIPLDLSQTRLPMFTVAVVYLLSGISNLLVARFTSVVVGGLTLLGIYIYGKEHISQEAGLLAALFLAISPFFLSFARLAFTESDVFLACTLTWFLVTVTRLQVKLSLGRAALAGLTLGLSISAKATVLVILPAIWFSMVLIWFSRGESESNRAKTIRPGAVWFWAGWLVLVLLAGVYSWLKLDMAAHPLARSYLLYGLFFLSWLTPLGWAFRFRNHTADPLSLAALVTGIGLLTFVVFPPDHLTNSGILRSLFTRAENEISFNLGFMGEVAALHLLVLFFKSTPVLGFGLLSGVVASLTQWRHRELMLPLLFVLSYFAGLLLIPLGQTFYTIPLLPMLSLLAAHQFLRLWSHQRRIAIILAMLAFGWWGVEMYQSYPDYHLNGLQWVGQRPLFGRSSIGYRSVVYTPSDGVQQVVEWLNDHAKPGQVAQLYILPWHIVRRITPNPPYRMTNGFEDTLDSNPDYVVLHINALLWQGHGLDAPVGGVYLYPFDKERLEREYEQVYVVRRAFGLEVASVWQRISLGLEDSNQPEIEEQELPNTDGLEANFHIPAQSDWVDRGTIFEAGASGEWDYYLWGGFAFSVVKKDGVYFLYYQGSSDYRSDFDETVLWRAIGVATSPDGINFSKYDGNPVLTWTPNQNGEEGAVSSGVTLGEQGEMMLFYGANTEVSATLVNADVRVAISLEGLNFTDLGMTLNHEDSSVWGSGDELFPVDAIYHQGRWIVYYIPNGTFQSGRLGVAFGDRYDNLSQSSAVMSGNEQIRVWGTVGHVPLSPDTFALTLNNVRENRIEVRLFSAGSPHILSEPVVVYQFDDVQQAVLFLDEERKTWFMFYRDVDRYGVKLAPYGD